MFGLVNKNKYNSLKQRYEEMHKFNKECSEIHMSYSRIIDNLNNNTKQLKEEIIYLNSEVLRLKLEKGINLDKEKIKELCEKAQDEIDWKYDFYSGYQEMMSRIDDLLEQIIKEVGVGTNNKYIKQ